MRIISTPKTRHRWFRLGLAASAVVLLSTCSPLPSLIDQVKTLGELRVVTRSGPLSYYLGSDDAPQGPEYALAQRFAEKTGKDPAPLLVSEFLSTPSAKFGGEKDR